MKNQKLKLEDFQVNQLSEKQILSLSGGLGGNKPIVFYLYIDVDGILNYYDINGHPIQNMGNASGWPPNYQIIIINHPL